MTTETEALRAAFEDYINPEGDVALHWQPAGYYAGGGLQGRWLDFQSGYWAGHAAAKAETTEAKPCQCATCLPIDQKTHMVVCSICGNKRCPHATNHIFACTGSNQPGQPGSSYGTPLYTADQLAAAVAKERERCIGIIESHHIPVGNSAAGEMACEWTYDALKTIRDAIRAGETGEPS